MALLGLISLTVSCQQGGKTAETVESTETVQTPVPDFPEAFAQGHEALGGLDKWKSYGTLTFSEVSETDTTKYTVDLMSRHERIEKYGHYKVGFTADDMAFYPNRDSFPSENPRFMHNLRFYFFAIPYVTADPGAFQEEMEPTEMDGKMYNRVKITFGDGVGVAPKDQYILWYNQSDNMLAFINYSVTYFNEGNAKKYNAIVYSNWKEAGGIKFPGTMTGYRWENGTFGEERYSRNFDMIEVSEERPNPAIFTNLSD